MIQEAYVKFDTANLLKEKGFPQDPYMCNTAYTWKGKLSNNARSFMPNSNSIIPIRCYSIAPTQQMARQWLRENKRLEIAVIPKNGNVIDGKIIYEYKWEIYADVIIDCKIYHATYEVAAEDAIRYCLEHLI